MKAVELFAGAGGLALGVERAGFELVSVVEKDPRACETLRANTGWPLQGCDVRHVDHTSFAGKVDLVSGGPPCQPFSLAGGHRAFLDPRDMFPEAVRAIREIAPRAFIFENVRGFTRPAFANYTEYIRLCLRHPSLVMRDDEQWQDHFKRLEEHETKGNEEDLRYNVVQRVLNAADYGIPQKRERVFMVGIREDVAMPFHFPAPTHSREALLWSKWRTGQYWEQHGIQPVLDEREQERASRITEKPRESPWRTIRDALSDLPDPENEPHLAERICNHIHVPGARVYPGHTGSPVDQPAKTLKAGVNGVPGGENMMRRPDGSVRYFTIRECARLQTFPDNFRFHGTRTAIMRQLGNAVPVSLAEVMAKTVREALEMHARGMIHDLGLR